ncbi:hypothetical protein AGMMS49944_15430 [Spirochaetia bacterium]|nr:hypothetical protein AGMMS49944_15430 [Spirochaetia bacterium]
MSDSNVVEREFAPLLAIRDNHPKFVLSLDTLWDYIKDGVQRRNLIDFLMDKGALHA